MERKTLTIGSPDEPERGLWPGASTPLPYDEVVAAGRRARCEPLPVIDRVHCESHRATDVRDGARRAIIVAAPD